MEIAGAVLEPKIDFNVRPGIVEPELPGYIR